MKNTSKKHAPFAKVYNTVQRHWVIKDFALWLIGSMGALFIFNQILDYFQLNFFSSIASPITLFILLSIIVALIRTLWSLVKSANTESSIPEYIDDNDSLIEMLKEAESHSRWGEIIKIGSALSDVLWFTSRKKLRVAIGHFVAVAAEQVDDQQTLAHTLIEDLGNTIMGLGKVDDGIKYINRGIRIAEKNNYTFLVVRGYRNLSTCYAFKNDTKAASTYLQKAEDAANGLSSESDKLSALGAIEYARSKILKHQSLFPLAIDALDKSIGYYDQLSTKYPETTQKNTDRIVKIYREKGVILLKQNTDTSKDEANDALQKGLRLALAASNYDNIIRCCCMLAKLQIENQAIDTAEGTLQIAKQNINNVDTPAIINEYNEVVRKLEFEKYGTK